MFQKRQMRLDLPLERTYSVAEIARIAKVSLRQLQWWDEQGLVSPRQEYHKRLYDLEDGIEVTVIAELRRKGVSLQKIRRIIRFLRRELGRRLPDLLFTGSTLHLLTDGKTFSLEDRPGRIIELMTNARKPMLLVCVSDQIDRLIELPRRTARAS